MQDINPMAHFSSEQAYKTEQFKKKFPDADPRAIESVMSADLAKIGVIDSIRLNLAFEYGLVDKDDQDQWIEKKYGVDVTEVDAEPDVMMKTDARDIKKKLQGVQSTELPQVKDYKTIKEQRVAEAKVKSDRLKGEWAPVVDRAVLSMQELPIPFKDADGKDDVFKFTIPAETLKPYAAKVAEVLATAGKEVDEGTLKAAMSSVYERVLIDNYQKIMSAYANKKLAELDESWSRETNNPRKINQAQKPVEVQDVKPHSKEAAEQEILGGW